MTTYCASTFTKLPRGIRVPAMLILTAASFVICLSPLRAAQEADLLKLQKELVATLDTRLSRTSAERRIGQRTDFEIILAMEDYYKELETACVMEALAASKKTVEDTQTLQVRIEAVTAASEAFSAFAASLQDRYTVGEITPVEVAIGKAAALKAEIRLETLKKQLPANAGKPTRPCEIAAQLEATKQNQ